MTAVELNALGWKLRRGGPRWHRYVELARELRAGIGWSHETAERVAAALRLGPKPLPFARCGCRSGAKTVLSLPDRWVSQCDDCQARWVTVERKASV